MKQPAGSRSLFSFEDYFKDSADEPQKAADRALKLIIKGTGILEMDENILHPFVRVHIVDLTTKKYLAKGKREDPGVANRESCSFFQVDDNALDKSSKYKPLTINTDFFLPFSTRMYDLRVKGNNFCEWEEEFVINERAGNIYKEDVMFLFELLEFHPKLVIADSALLRPDRLYPIAWAYLRPLGSATLHMNRIKLQLYRFKF